MVRGYGKRSRKPTWTLKLWAFSRGNLLVPGIYFSGWTVGFSVERWCEMTSPPAWWVLARSLGDKLLLGQVLCLVAKSSENAVTVGEEALSMYQSMGMKDKVRLPGTWVWCSMSWGRRRRNMQFHNTQEVFECFKRDRLLFGKGRFSLQVWKEKYGLGMSQNYVRRTWLIFLVTDFLVGFLLGFLRGDIAMKLCFFLSITPQNGGFGSDDFTCQRGAFHVV